MHRVSFFLREDLERGLQQIKARDGVPVAESIRRAIEAYLTEKGTLKTAKTRKAKR